MPCIFRAYDEWGREVSFLHFCSWAPVKAWGTTSRADCDRYHFVISRQEGKKTARATKLSPVGLFEKGTLKRILTDEEE
jgi:hypothetical protein